MGAVKEEFINNIPTEEDLDGYYQDYKQKEKGWKKNGISRKDVLRVGGEVYDSRGDL
jgi:hypothetical protein